MDRDRSENTLDPVEHVSPSTGGNDTGDVGVEEARILKTRQKHGTEPGPDSEIKAPEPDRAPGRGA